MLFKWYIPQHSTKSWFKKVLSEYFILLKHFTVVQAYIFFHLIFLSTHEKDSAPVIIQKKKDFLIIAGLGKCWTKAFLFWVEWFSIREKGGYMYLKWGKYLENLLQLQNMPISSLSKEWIPIKEILLLAESTIRVPFNR